MGTEVIKLTGSAKITTDTEAFPGVSKVTKGVKILYWLFLAFSW